MAEPKVTLKNCKICKKELASDLKTCIHCGASDPIKKEKDYFTLVVTIIVIGLIIALAGSS